MIRLAKHLALPKSGGAIAVLLEFDKGGTSLPLRGKGNKIYSTVCLGHASHCYQGSNIDNSLVIRLILCVKKPSQS